MNLKPIIAGTLLIAALGLTGGGLAVWKYRADQKAANQPAFAPPEFVQVKQVETIPWQPTARLVGTVVAKRSVTLANEVVGVVADVGFESGDTLEPGQVLLTMDTTTEKADLAAAEAAERLAAASIDVADASIRAAESTVSLAENNSRRHHDASAAAVAATELDRVDAELLKARADLDREKAARIRAEAERDQAAARAAEVRAKIAKKTLTAPFRARAGMRSVHPGQYLAEGTSIVSLTELTDDIYLDFAIPQEYAARVIPGAVVTARSTMLGNDLLRITVLSIDATVNPVTRNVRVRSSVPNPGYMLKPGMSIDVQVPVELVRDEIVIPATSVRRAAFGDHVFILVPGDAQKDPPGSFRAQQRMIVLGPNVEGRVIVRSGLKDGEKIAADGSFKLREGALVFAAPEGGAPPAPDQAGKTADLNH